MTKKRGKANKKPKLEIKFDDQARREFLSGFHKRKLQKKAFYKTKLEKRLAEEKQRIRAEAKKSVGRVSSSHAILPEVEKILGFTQDDLEDELKTKSESFVLGTKTVTISSLDSIHTKLPPLDDDDSEDEEDPRTGQEHVNPPVLPPNKNIKSMLKKTTNQLLQQSKTYKTAQRFKLKSKKSRGKNRLARAGPADTKEPAGSRVMAAKHAKQKQGKGKQKQLHPLSKKGKRAKLDPRNTKVSKRK